MTELQPLSQRVRRPGNVLSVLVAAVTVLLVVRLGMQVDWTSVTSQLLSADLIMLAGAVVLFHGLVLVRTLRWRTLLGNVEADPTVDRKLSDFAGLARIVYLAWFANCVTVARLGDAYRSYLLKRSAGVSFAVTLGTVLSERVLDLCTLVVLLGGTALFAFRGQLPAPVVTLLLVGVPVAAIGLGVVLCLRRFRRTAEFLLPEQLHSQYERFERGTAGSLTSGPTLLVFTVLAWAIEGTTMLLVAHAAGVSISLPVAFTAAFLAALLSVVPVTPGGLGVTELGLSVVFQWFGLDATTATTVALLSRLVTYWSVVAFGFGLYVLTLRWPIDLPRSGPTDGDGHGTPDPSMEASRP